MARPGSSQLYFRLLNLIFKSIISCQSNFIAIYIKCKPSRNWANRWPLGGATWP